MRVADWILGVVHSRNALPRSGRTGRDYRIDVRNDSDGRTERDVRLLMRGMPSTNVMTTNTTMLAINSAEILLGCIEHRKGGPIGDLNSDYTHAHREFASLLPMGLGFLAGTALGAVAYIAVGLFR
jgi:hypothetical protein